MTQSEKNLKKMLSAIGGAMIVFVAMIQVVYALPMGIAVAIEEMFPHSPIAECVAEFLSSAGYFLSFLLPTVILNKWFARSLAQPIPFSLKLPSERTRRKTLAYIFAGISLVLVTAILNANLVPSVDLGIEEKMSHPYQLLLAAFSTAVIPAFSEELLFRGAILSNLKPYGKNMAIIVSALLFGLMHQHAGQLLYATAAGLVMGYIAVECDSIWPTVLLHFLNNLFSVLETYVYDIFRDSTANMICMVLELCIFLLGVIFGALYVAAIRREAREKKSTGVFGNMGEIGESRTAVEPQKAIKFFFCPTVIIFLVLAVGNMFLIYALY